MSARVIYGIYSTFFLIGNFKVVNLKSIAFASSIPEVSASLEPEQGTLGEEFILKVHIQGNFENEKIALPKVEGLRFRDVGRSMQISIGSQIGFGGQSTSSRTATVTRQFKIVVSKSGKYQIPGPTVSINGQTIKTDPLTLTVGDALNYIPLRSNQNIAALSIQRDLSNEAPYVGEPVKITTKFTQMANLEVLKVERAAPKSTDMRLLEGDHKVSKMSLGGQMYNVVTFSDRLVPLTPGDFTLDPDSVSVHLVERSQNRQRDDFWGFGHFFNQQVKKRNLSTTPNTIHVQPLPSKGKPDNFSGLVGDFTIHSEVSAREIRQGDSTTATVIIEGEGLLDQLNSLPLADLKGFKVYEDKPESKETIDDKGIHSRKIFKFALVPTIAGELPIGKIRVSYFNISTKSYQWLTSDFGSLSVEKSDSKQENEPTALVESASKPKDVMALGNDLADIYRKTHLKRDDIGPNLLRIFLYSIIILPILLVLLFIAKFWFSSRNSRLLARRPTLAHSTYKKRKADWTKKWQGQENSQTAIVEFYRIFLLYLGDKFSLQAGNFTFKDLKPYFLRSGLNETLVSSLEVAMKDVDSIAYGQRTGSEITNSDLVATLNQIVKDIDSNV